MADRRDLELRTTALDRVRELQARYDDLIPRPAILEGFWHQGRRISFGTLVSGTFRILHPRRTDERPDPERLELRFERFRVA